MNFVWIADNIPKITNYLLWHIYLSVVPCILGCIVAIPIGWVAYRWRRAYVGVIGLASLLYTVPSLALFILLPLVLGTQILNPLNVVVALTIYTVALLARVVADGLASVPPETVQAATGLGYTRLQRLFLVELPMAFPPLFGGLRVAIVSNVSIVTVAALIGIPQLGSLFTYGFQLWLWTPIIVGIVLCVILAVGLDLLTQALGRAVTPWRPKPRSGA